MPHTVLPHTDSQVKEILTWMDGEWGKSSPLNSVTKLAAALNKSKGRVHYTRWVVMMVQDRI